MVQRLIRALGLKKPSSRPQRQYSIGRPRMLPKNLEFYPGDLVFLADSRDIWKVVDYRDYFPVRLWGAFEKGTEIAVKRGRTVLSKNRNVVKHFKKKGLS